MGTLRTFTADGQGAPQPQGAVGDSGKNDVVADTKPCTRVNNFLTNTQSRLIYQCEASGPWFEAGKQVYDGGHSLFALGLNNLGLSASSTLALSVVDLVDSSIVAAGDFSGLVATRSHGKGFHVATATNVGLFLVNIDAAGVTSQVAAYPASALQFPSDSAVLGADDTLYELGRVNAKVTIMRFQPKGLGETVYTEKAGDLFIWQSAYLVTGP